MPKISLGNVVRVLTESLSYNPFGENHFNKFIYSEPIKLIGHNAQLKKWLGIFTGKFGEGYVVLPSPKSITIRVSPGGFNLKSYRNGKELMGWKFIPDWKRVHCVQIFSTELKMILDGQNICNICNKLHDSNCPKLRFEDAIQTTS